LRATRRLFPFVEVIFADGAYRGETTAKAMAGTGRWRLEIVSRGDARGFVPLAKRWIVERTFAWLGRCRRLAKDFENQPGRQRARLPRPRHDPPHAPPARKGFSSLLILPDGL
jgi:transposase